MAFQNSIYSSLIMNNENLEPSEAAFSNIKGSESVFKIAIQVASEVNRSSDPLPDPAENPTQTFHVSFYPRSYSNVFDSSPLVEKTISASGEEITKTVTFNVVGVNAWKVKVTNANDFGTIVSMAVTEATLT